MQEKASRARKNDCLQRAKMDADRAEEVVGCFCLGICVNVTESHLQRPQHRVGFILPPDELKTVGTPYMCTY